jgi:hypothetical protein
VSATTELACPVCKPGKVVATAWMAGDHKSWLTVLHCDTCPDKSRAVTASSPVGGSYRTKDQSIAAARAVWESIRL